MLPDASCQLAARIIRVDAYQHDPGKHKKLSLDVDEERAFLKVEWIQALLIGDEWVEVFNEEKGDE